MNVTVNEQAAELRQILDFTPQLIAVYGPNRERLYVNRVGLEYLGLTLEEWRQTPARGAFVHPDDRARELDCFDGALSTGSAYELELRLRNGDGSYRWFRRVARAFVALNCAAIPRDLIASELFGHEKGAFTGAVQRRLGRFELANGGTILLDEVGELSSDTQVALLRVLQEREFERVGGRERIHVDVRVIAATNRDLTAAVADGTFRQDLFYRLNVFPIEVPPLRDRREDIPMLAEYFIGRYARKAGKAFRRVSKRSLDHLQSYPWPGNIRELQNVIERSVIVSDTDQFVVDESWLSAAPQVESRLGLSSTLAVHEKAIIEDALRACEGRVFGPSGAAARLGIPRSTLESRIRALKIKKSRFRTRTAKNS